MRKRINRHTPTPTKSKAQHQRNPLLNVRLTRELYTQLQDAAKADSRTLADWLRLNLPRLLTFTAATTTLSSATANASTTIRVDAENPRYAQAMRDIANGKFTVSAAGVQEPTEPSKP